MSDRRETDGAVSVFALTSSSSGSRHMNTAKYIWVCYATHTTSLVGTHKYIDRGYVKHACKDSYSLFDATFASAESTDPLSGGMNTGLHIQNKITQKITHTKYDRKHSDLLSSSESKLMITFTDSTWFMTLHLLSSLWTQHEVDMDTLNSILWRISQTNDSIHGCATLN